MDIKERLERLYRNFDDHPQDWWKDQFVRLVDVVVELNDRQHVHGNTLSDQDERLDHHITLINGLLNRESKPKEQPQEELKPCPFCACKNIKYGRDALGIYTWFYCSDCEANAKSSLTWEKAKEAWNRRSNA